jgi:polar amino acid transport system substrate-binding protein
MNAFFQKLFITLLLLSVPLTSYAEENATTITMLTEIYPPYNMEIEGKLTGIAVDLLDAMLETLDTGQGRDDVILTNWSRAYTMAEKKKNHMVFSTTRTEQREPLFKWVGPIAKTTVGVIAPKVKGIVINELSDLNQYRIGTILKDIGEQILLESGIQKTQLHSISGTNCIDLSFKKMKNDRIDMFAYAIASATYNAKRMGHDLDDFEVIYTLTKGELYYAFNKNTDDTIIAQWQAALDTIKGNGLYDKIVQKY